MSKTRIVIVGGGAAGLGLATRMAKSYPREQYDITLVDKSSTHVWKPLLHEIAAGALDAANDEISYQAHSSASGYTYVEGTLCSIDAELRSIGLSPLTDDQGDEIAPGKTIPYDYLTLAIGSITNDFGIPGVREHCMLLDSRDQADAFRRRFQLECLRIARCTSDALPQQTRVVIVGGGATGVELAAELCNAAKARVDYGVVGFASSAVLVTLLEAGPRILPALPERLASRAAAELLAMGVEVRTRVAVVSSESTGMQTSDGEVILADIQLWAAGVKGNVASINTGKLSVTQRGQFDVLPTLLIQGSSRIFAIGDCAQVILSPGERPVPPRAQAAHQMAGTVFENILRLANGKEPVAFVYRDYGTLVSLSHFAAVGTLMGSLARGSLSVSGRLARFVYNWLYRQHLKEVLGWRKWLAWLLVGRANRILRPRLKLH